MKWSHGTYQNTMWVMLRQIPYVRDLYSTMKLTWKFATCISRSIVSSSSSFPMRFFFLSFCGTTIDYKQRSVCYCVFYHHCFDWHRFLLCCEFLFLFPRASLWTNFSLQLLASSRKQLYSHTKVQPQFFHCLRQRIFQLYFTERVLFHVFLFADTINGWVTCQPVFRAFANEPYWWDLLL